MIHLPQWFEFLLACVPCAVLLIAHERDSSRRRRIRRQERRERLWPLRQPLNGGRNDGTNDAADA